MHYLLCVGYDVAIGEGGEVVKSLVMRQTFNDLLVNTTFERDQYRRYSQAVIEYFFLNDVTENLINGNDNSVLSK